MKNYRKKRFCTPKNRLLFCLVCTTKLFSTVAKNTQPAVESTIYQQIIRLSGQVDTLPAKSWYAIARKGGAAMKRRIKLVNRVLPDYTLGEECMNMATHIVGGGFAILILLLCMLRGDVYAHPWRAICCGIYGISMITVYAISSIYHGLRTNTSKKVMQVLDHCAIYLLIAGTYTPIIACGIMKKYFLLGIILLTIQWGLAALAITLNAIDLHKFKSFSMICYIALGWCIIFCLPQFLTVIDIIGFWFLLAGGISYSIGAVLFGLGTKVRWMHSVFHIFVVIGSLLQFVAIYFYIL